MNHLQHTIVLLVVLILALPPTLSSCSAKNVDGAPTHHNTLFRTHWENLYKSNTPQKRDPMPSEKKDTSTPQGDPRSRIVNAALALLEQSTVEDHYGANDVQTVFSKAGFPSCWKQNIDVPQLVKKATTEDAYFTQSRPTAGDLVLFHNQFDRNRNGQSDDWFTGVAVVVESRRKTLTAVTRTAGAPKRVVLSPNGPMVHTHREKVRNSFIKIPTPHDPTDAQYLAGQLYAGYIDTDVVLANCRK